MIIAAIPSISIICYKGIYRNEPIFFEVFILTAAATLVLGIVFGLMGEPEPQEVALREKFYRKVGDPYFRSGYEPVFQTEESGVLAQPLPAEVVKGS